MRTDWTRQLIATHYYPARDGRWRAARKVKSMCFYHDDYGWSAEVCESTFVRGADECRCIECNRTIRSGEWRQRIWQQEHEECQICEDDFSDGYDDEVRKELCKHDYGETFGAEICRECCLMLEAIYDLERIEGCPEDARQPACGELKQVLYDEKTEHRVRKYRQHALTMFPQLVGSVILTDTQCDEH